MGGPVEAQWFIVEISVALTDSDAVSGALWAAGATGIEERAMPVELTEPVVVLEVATPASALPAVLAVAGPGAAVREVASHDVASDWSRWAPPVRVGKVLVEAAGRGAREVHAGSTAVVSIRAEGAFGWGGHATTVLALQLLQACLRPGLSVLDVGTGTGVLAIAAARLGARTVLAIDVDAEARRVADENVRANRAADTVSVSDQSVDAVADHYDIVVANLERGVLIDRAQALASRIASGGALVISGFLVAHEDEVMDAYDELRWRAPVRSGEWSAALGTRRAS